MNKRAALTDSIFVPIFILILVMTTFIGLYVWLSFQQGMIEVLGTSRFISPAHNTTITDAMSEITIGISSIDYMMPVIIVGLLLVSLIFAFRTGSSVLYAFVSIVLWGFALLMSAVLTNTFETFKNAMPANLPGILSISTYMIENIKWIILAWLFLISVVMFTRTKKEEQNLAAAEIAYGFQ